MQPFISTVSHKRDFCLLGVFVQVSRAEQLLEARAVLPGWNSHRAGCELCQEQHSRG